MIVDPVHLGLLVSALVVGSCLTVGIPRLATGAPLRAAPWTPKMRGLLFLAVLAALWIPVNTLPVLYYLRGLLGDFSVTSLILATVALIGQFRGQPLMDPAQRTIILTGLALTAALFYPPTLGLTSFDPYAWGYFTTPFLIGLGLLGFLALALRLYWIVFILGSGMLFASLAILPSTNLWDYFIDPALAVFAIVATFIILFRRLFCR